MRISQELARRIAKKMTEKKEKQVDKLHLLFRRLVTNLYWQSIPKAVFDARELHPDWFEAKGSIVLQGHGFEYTSISVVGAYVPANNDGRAKLKLTPEMAAQIKTAQWEWEKCRDEYSKLVDEIQQALISLGTYKQIRENFVEAAQFLPETGPKSLALIPNLSGLKERLKSQV
jgi:hypothetical protein